MLLAGLSLLLLCFGFFIFVSLEVGVDLKEWIEAIYVGFIYCLLAVIFVGWIVLPLGAVLGCLYWRRFNKSLNADASDAGAG